MEIKEKNLEELEEKSLNNYRWKFLELEKKRFVDFVQDGLGKMCTMYYHPKTKKHELEVI